MTQLQTTSNNHLPCLCGHSKLVSVKTLIGRLSPANTIYEFARMAKCSHCGTKGVVDLGCIMFVRRRRFVMAECIDCGVQLAR